MTAEKDNLDHELMSLVAMPTKLAEITAQGVRQIACGLHHVLALVGRRRRVRVGRRRRGAARPRPPQVVPGAAARVGDDAERRAPDRRGVEALGGAHVRRARNSGAILRSDALLLHRYNGLVYTWGSSSHGQLGHGNKRTQLQPKLCEALEAECRERSSTARLLGCGSKHTVAVLGNGSLYMWGRADFGKLGRSKSDAQTEPFLIEALWRREVAAGSTDKTKSLSKAEISELLEQRLDVHDILR